MNSDFRLAVGFSRHHKTRKLKRALGAEGVLSLIWLWEYAAAERPDGDLSRLDDDDIELAADWDGEPGAFVAAIRSIGFLDVGNLLHDWQEHNAWASNADARSDKARLSKLAQVNLSEYQRLVAEGITGISKEQYEKLAKAGDNLRTASEPLATANETLADGKQIDCAALAPSPSPSLSLKEQKKRGGKPAPPCCPQLKIVALYHDELPTLPHMKIWEGDATREGNLRARWRERWEKQKYTTAEEGLAYWQRLFRHVRDCPWLMGEITPRDGKPPFRADLAWLVRPENFAKLIEGKYDRRPEQ